MAGENLANLNIASLLGIPVWLLTILVIWALVWKGLALWKAARKKHLVWFIALLVINTFGILEILYIFLFSKISLEMKSVRQRRAEKSLKLVGEKVKQAKAAKVKKAKAKKR